MEVSANFTFPIAIESCVSAPVIGFPAVFFSKGIGFEILQAKEAASTLGKSPHIYEYEQAELAQLAALRIFESCFEISLLGHVCCANSMDAKKGRFFSFALDLEKKQFLLSPQTSFSLGFDPPLV